MWPVLWECVPLSIRWFAPQTPGQPVAFVVPPRHPCLPWLFFWLLLEITRYITNCQRSPWREYPVLGSVKMKVIFLNFQRPTFFNFDEIHFQFEFKFYFETLCPTCKHFITHFLLEILVKTLTFSPAIHCHLSFYTV